MILTGREHSAKLRNRRNEGVGFFSGQNGWGWRRMQFTPRRKAGTMALVCDKAGLEGTVLRKHAWKNFPVFGAGCCKLNV